MDRLLLVDDDTELCELVSEYLGQEGFEIDAVHDGVTGVERAAAGTYALVILDVMLPELGGFDVLRRLREHSEVPVLMLTARGDEVDRIVGLELGADDYLAKPFNPRELSARIRAILRRSRSGDESSPALLGAGDLELDIGGRSARVSGEEVELTGIEFELLAVLVRSSGSVVSRDELSRQALGRRASAFDRSLDVHISNLRRKLGPSSDGKDRIKTVRGVGYIYVRSAHSSRGGADA
jgi:two-component system response regulator CpxR